MRKIQACRNDQRGKEHNHASDNKDVFFLLGSCKGKVTILTGGT